MRRRLALVLVTVLALAACTAGDVDPDPEPDPDPPAEEDPGPTGLRVGIVLPPADRAGADEVDAERLALEDLVEANDGLADLRVIVPDSREFVGDVAGLLVAEGHDLVCVLGSSGEEVVLDLADRRPATEFCAVPGDPEAEVPDNVLLADLAVEELGHVAGVALAALVGQEPGELLLGTQRTGLDRFRSGFRAGFGEGELREVTGDAEDLEAEIDVAVEDDVAALVVDAAADGAEVVRDAAGQLPTVASATLLDADDAALVWRLRWDRIVEAVVTWHLDGEPEVPTSFGIGEQAFELTPGGASTSAMRAAVETASSELARGQRDPLEPVGGDHEEDDLDDAE